MEPALYSRMDRTTRSTGPAIERRIDTSLREAIQPSDGLNVTGWPSGDAGQIQPPTSLPAKPFFFEEARGRTGAPHV